MGQFGDVLTTTIVPELLTDENGNVIGLLRLWDQATGTLTIYRENGDTYLLSTFQMILRSVTFHNPSQNPQAGDRVLTFTVEDATEAGPSNSITVNFVTVNQAPAIVEFNTSQLSAVEGATPVQIADVFSIADIDNVNMAGASVAITGVFEANMDTLTCTTASALGITCAYDGASGVLTMTGAASVIAYQDAMKGVVYSSEGGAGHSGLRTLTFTVTDGTSSSEAVSRNLYLNAVNNAPTVTGPTTDTGYTDEQTPFTVQPTLVVADTDSVTLASATVTVTSGFDSAVDVLSVTVPGGYGIGHNIDGVTGVITFTGVASAERYQDVLRTVAIDHSGISASTNRVFSFVVSDGQLSSSPLVRRVWAFDFGSMPTVTNATTSATSGETVTITGQNFGPASPLVVNYVQIGGEQCTNIQITKEDTELTCTAPPGTGTNVVVSMSVNDILSPNYAIFNYLPPAVTAASPAATSGGTVTITGTNFGILGSSRIGSVFINGVVCVNPEVTVPHTQIVCGYTIGVGGGYDVNLTIAGQSSGITGKGVYSYILPTVTSVLDGSHMGYNTTIVGNNFGPAGTANVLVTFERSALWNTTQNSTTSEFSCANAVVTVAHTTVVCTVPKMSLSTAANTGDLTRLYTAIVYVSNQNSGKLNTSSGYEQMQYLTSNITAASQVNMHGGWLTLTGIHLGPVGTPVTLHFVNRTDTNQTFYTVTGSATMATASGASVTTADTTATIYIPNYIDSGGVMNPVIRATIDTQTTNDLFPATALYEGPVITSNSSGSQFGNCRLSGADTCSHTVTITGRNFAPAENFNSVTKSSTIGSTYAKVLIGGTEPTSNTIIVLNSTTLTISTTPATTSPPLSTQDADIVVYMLCTGSTISTCQNSGTTGAGRWDYLGPTVTAATGTSTSGGQLTLTGQYFGAAGTTYSTASTTYSTAGVVVCADTTCSVTHVCGSPKVVSDTELTCTMPASGTAGIAYSGDVQLTLATMTGTGSSLFSFSSPSITNVTTAPTDGGTVYLHGKNLGMCASCTSLTLGGTACTGLTFVTQSTQFQCTMVAGTGGSMPAVLNITSGTGNYRTAQQPAGFSYTSPSVSAVTATSTSGGTVTITGSDFGTDASQISVTVGSISVDSIAVVSSSEITGYLNGTGTGANLAVTPVVNGQTGTAASIYNFTAPTVTAVVSPAPTMFGSGTLTIEGTNFGPTSTDTALVSATISGTPAVNTSSCSVTTAHTRITCTTDGCGTSSCGNSARDITVTVNTLDTGTTGAGLLTFGSPVITTVYGSKSGSTWDGQVSYFAQNYDIVQIVGYNFGNLAPSVDGSYLTEVLFCEKNSTLWCTASDWVNITSFSKASSTLLTAQIPASKPDASNHTLKVTIGGYDSGTTGSSVIKSYLGPNATAVTTASGGVTTAGGTITVTGQRFGPVGTWQISQIIWDNLDTGTTGQLLEAAAQSAQVTVQNTELTFTAPEGTGTVGFQVSIKNGNSSSASYLKTPIMTFTYAIPVITALSTVAVQGGVLTITGTSFGPVGSQYVSSVTVYNSNVTLACSNPQVTVAHTQITCTLPAGTATGLTALLYVDGQANDFNATGAPTFSYAAPAVTVAGPISTNLNANASAIHLSNGINATGPWVAIQGSNFGFLNTSITSVTIEGVACTFPYVTVYDTEIQCLLGTAGSADGSGSGGGYNVSVTVPSGLTTTQLAAFSYSVPTISDVPQSGFFGSERITITGGNFGCVWNSTSECVLPLSRSNNITVTFGGVPGVNLTQISHSQFSVLTPDISHFTTISDLDLIVYVEGQASAVTKYSFSGPNITAVSEASIFGGVVTITGVNFGPLGDSNIKEVKVGDNIQELTIAVPNVTKAGTELTFLAPAGRGVNLDVELTIATQTTGTSGDFTLDYAGPRVEGSIGSSTTGGAVTIIGRNFGPVGNLNINEVTVKGEPCLEPSVIVTNTQLRCNVTAGSGGPYDVTVRISDETDLGTGLRKYNYSVPIILAVEPLDPPPGSSITITGDAFGQNISEVAVSIGGTACTSVAYVSTHTQLTCITPFTTGFNKVLLITVDGLTSAPNYFAYSPPNVTSVTSAPTLGGLITITGRNFGPVGDAAIDAVTLGSSSCTKPNVTVADTEIQCTAAEALTIANGGTFAAADLDEDGRMNVVVNISGQSSGATGDNAFEHDVCTLDAISTQTSLYYTDTVLISGTGYGTTAEALAMEVGGEHVTVFTLVQTDIAFSFQMPIGLGVSRLLTLRVNGRACTTAAFNDQNGPRVSYGTPVVQRADNLLVPGPSTRGGLATLQGKGFGPVGPDNVNRVLIDGGMECREANVTVADSELQCSVGGGAGSHLNVTVFIAGRSSGNTGDLAFYYANPYVNYTNPKDIIEGTKLYLFGENFGTGVGPKSQIVVKLQGKAHLPNEGFDCYNAQIIQFHNQIQCTVGPGVGGSIRPLVYVGGNNNSDTSLNQYNLSYSRPFILSVSKSKTQGGADAAIGGNGPVTITGLNFGPAGAQWVAFFDYNPLLGGYPCTDPIVTVDSTQIQCVPPAGVGLGLDVLLSMGGLDSGNSGNGLFSYLPPQIDSMLALSTSGGQTTITGANFGPAGGAANVTVMTGEICPAGIPNATFYGETGCTILEELGQCTDIIVQSHTELTCMMSPGTGADYDVRVDVGGQNSGLTGDAVFRYQPPVVTNLSPLSQPQGAQPGDSLVLTITGLNFGRSLYDLEKIRVRVGARYCNQSSIRLINFANEAYSEITARLPYGAGISLPVVVEVDGQESDENDVARFSYISPAVLASTPTPAIGGMTTITGANFGPVGEIFQVLVAGEPCTGAAVTVSDSQITCNVVAGTGAELDIFVRITNTSTMNSGSTGVGKFRYLSPVVTGVNPVVARSGTQITVTGSNFGSTVANIRLDFGWPETLGGALAGVWSAGEYRMLVSDQKFVAKVPVGYGTNLEVLVNVDGQYQNQTESGGGAGLNATRFTFAYLPPQVLSAGVVPTAGGKLTVQGDDLGPISEASALDFVRVRGWQGQILQCLNPQVVVDNAEVECDLPAGSGKSLDVQISTGGQASDWEKVFRFEAPVIENVQPPRAHAYDLITISGRNFGYSHPEVQLFFDSKLVNATEFNLTKNHTELVFRVPLGSGAQKGFAMRLPVDPVTGDLLFSQDSVDTIPAPNASVTFSYPIPEPLAITSAFTHGGNVTITGDNFGPAGTQFLESVQVNAMPCQNPVVTVDNTEIMCQAGAGSGLGLPVVVVVNGQTSLALQEYSYTAPQVDQIRPERAFPGDPLILTGRSFGVNPGAIQVMLGDTACTGVAVLEAHFEIRCIVGQSQGSNQTVAVTVNGVEGVQDPTRLSFVYRKAGCSSVESENYNPAVTDDDGSCRVLGCTQPEASNYNPGANVNDGSCIRAPETISMKVKLDFAEYQSRPEYYDQLFLDDVAGQLAINVSRLVMLEVKSGSTVFIFQIMDTPESRAQDVALRLENMVVSNEWSMAVFTLLQFLWEDSPKGPVDAKAEEPRVSMWSIIGITVALPLLLLWAVFWRRSLLMCARKCCGSETEEDIERQMMMEGGQVKSRFGSQTGGPYASQREGSTGSASAFGSNMFGSVNRFGSATSAKPQGSTTGPASARVGSNTAPAVAKSGASGSQPLRLTAAIPQGDS